MTPDPMNSMLAIKKMLDRKEMVVTNIPLTAGNTALQSETVV